MCVDVCMKIIMYIFFFKHNNVTKKKLTVKTNCQYIIANGLGALPNILVYNFPN